MFISPGKHIVIVTGQHMTANPRVWKEANSLAQAGCSVTVLTTWYDKRRLQEDKKLLNPQVKYKAGVNLLAGSASLIERLVPRLTKRLAAYAKKFLNRDSIDLVTYWPKRQLNKALAERADLYIGHQETGLIIGCELLRNGKNVAFDFEDWYSRDYINHLRPTKLLERYEAVAMRKGLYVTCPSDTMARALKARYRALETPKVIYNGFSRTETIRLPCKKYPNSLVWFSQVIGPNRGLETLLPALDYIKEPISLALLGDCEVSYEILLRNMMPSQHSLKIYKPIPHDEIPMFLSQFFVGLALENSSPESRNTTVTNKILQYLQAGVNILATSTGGQREVAALLPEGTVRLVKHDAPEEWAKGILTLLRQPNQSEKLAQCFDEMFAWEVQEQKILKLISSKGA